MRGLAEEDPNTGVYGGKLSVRAPPKSKPLMIIGQDECIFHQYSMNYKKWVGPDGQRPLLPKTEGLGLMISMFQCREVGVLHTISPVDLQKINKLRSGTDYVAK